MAVLNIGAFEFLAKLGDESVDLVVTDPPYESLEKHRARGTTTRLSHSKSSSNDWFQTIPNDMLPRLLFELHRVLKKNSHCYIFCDDETSNLIWLYNQRFEGGPLFKWWKRIVWNKMAMGMGYHYRAKTEFILFLEKGKRKLRSASIPDFLDPEELDALIAKKRIRGGYPTEKPHEVSAVLIEQSTNPGDRVIDPFCGSGSVGWAATLLGRQFAGSDICAEAVEITRSRIKEAFDAKAKFDNVAAQGGS